jgi:hypothetical protein
MIKFRTEVDFSILRIGMLLFAVYAFASGVQYAAIIALFILVDLVMDKENSNQTVVKIYEVVSFIAIVGIVLYSFM